MESDDSTILVSSDRGKRSRVRPSSEDEARFRILLRELFQLDQADLDFGIYRILKIRQKEIERFIEQDLAQAVGRAFDRYRERSTEYIDRKIADAIKRARGVVDNPEESNEVRDLRAQRLRAVDVVGLEDEVFSALYTFFRRYYDEGDFISQRRYKDGAYAIPYQGEEVKLHWANYDQYYVKTSEDFQAYAFVLPSGRKVRFVVASAETDNNNNQTRAGNNKRFVLAGENPLSESEGVLEFRFEHRTSSARTKQSDLNQEIHDVILGTTGFEEWMRELAAQAPGPANHERTVLSQHLDVYTKKNTFDYFIHKDLGAFLRRELDFFIKNELLHMDDIQDPTESGYAERLSTIRVFREVGLRIIEFLAQLESFQKRLWLKKKFVLDTQYCMTLDRVPKNFYTEIAKNESQHDDWVAAFSIRDALGYSRPLSTDFLDANPHLVVDTRHFPEDFKARLLGSLENIDQLLDGIVIQGDNFQALQLSQTRFSGQIDCVYIDPPYNTDASPILYKNNYRHSSWLSLIHDRVRASGPLLKLDSIMCVAIDDTELPVLSTLLSDLFGEQNHLATAVVRSKPQGRATASGFSMNHEYALFFRRTKDAKVGRLPREGAKLARYPESDEDGIFAWTNFRNTGANTRRNDRRSLFYPLYVTETSIRVPNMEWNKDAEEWHTLEKPESSEKVIWPIDEYGDERIWRAGEARTRTRLKMDFEVRKVAGELQVYYKYRPNQEGALPDTWWADPKYSGTESGTVVLRDMFGMRGTFSYPKSLYLVMDCLRASRLDKDSMVLDFFAGSGTTAHATIELNREDRGKRKYLLAEMGDYFDTTLIPRIKKAVHAKEWKNGKPVTRTDGVSHVFKYIRLESYEDTLANVRLSRSQEQISLLEKQPDLRSEYILRYMLDVEADQSPPLLNVEAFKDPFAYKLTLARDGEKHNLPVDLVETFNWMLGVEVHRNRRDSGICYVVGVDMEGRRVLIIWRKLNQINNDVLNEWFRERGFNTENQDFDDVYVNGSNTLASLRGKEQTWRVHLTEEVFYRLMFHSENL